MKKFIYKLILFFSIPILFFVFTEGYIFSLKKDIFSDKKMDIIFSGIASNYQWVNTIEHKKILLLGSSSVRYGLSCTLLNKLSNDSLVFVNLAMDARDPIETYFLLTHINLTNVKAVYFGIDPWIYTKSYYKYRNSYLYLDMSLITSLKYGLEHDKSIFFKRIKSLIRYLLSSNKISQIDFNKNKQEIPADYGSVKLEGKPTNFNDPINEYFQIDKYGWSELQFSYLAKISTFCISKNIEFSVFLPPKRSDYSATYKSKCNLIHNEFVTNLIKENLNCQIFGKFNQLDTIGDYNLFREAYHLNANGQAVYSAIFYEMMLNKKELFSLNYKWFN